MLNKLIFFIVVSIFMIGFLITGTYAGMKYARQIDYRFFPNERSFFDTEGPGYKDYVFDAIYVIPNTSISVGYPSSGFYGWGIVRSDEVPAIEMPEPGSNYVWFASPPHRPDQDPLITVSVSSDPLPEETTLDHLLKKQVSYGYSLEDLRHGSIVSVNGHKYWLRKISLDPKHTAWHAIAFGKKEMVTILMNYGAGNGVISYKAYRNNDQLFFEILSRINFD